jgi:hypothetical protein
MNMRRAPLLGLALAFLLAIPVMVHAAPPTRPLDVTPSQYAQLRQIEGQPENLAVLDVRASYMSEHEKQLALTRASDDFWTIFYTGGLPALTITLLIAAAPL